jgi:hypothetical protein
LRVALRSRQLSQNKPAIRVSSSFFARNGLPLTGSVTLLAVDIDRPVGFTECPQAFCEIECLNLILARLKKIGRACGSDLVPADEIAIFHGGIPSAHSAASPSTAWTSVSGSSP